MTAGLVWMIVANAAVLLAARVAVRRCGTGRTSTDVLLFLLFRFAFIMALVLATGLAGLLTATGLGLICALLLGALLLAGERLRVPWNLDLSRSVPRLAIVFFTLYASRALFQTLTYSPMDGDATSYHLPKIAEWVRTGRLLVDLGSDPRSWFPAGFELVETWWVVFLHHDVLIELAGLEFLSLSAAAIWVLATWIGMGSCGSAVAALAFISVPGLAVQSITELNDGPAAALVLAGAALIVSRVSPALLVFLGGLAAGLKPTTVYALPGLLLLMALVRKEPRTAARAPSLNRLVAGLGLAIGGFWYARTWILAGHPLYPMGTDHMLTQKGAPLQGIGLSVSGLLQNLTALTDHRLYDVRRPYHGMLEFSAAWGPAIVACGLPALLWASRECPRLRLLGAGFALSLVSVLSLVVHDPFNLRFIFWFTALPALAMGWAVERHRRLAIPAVLTLAFTLLGTTFYSHYSLGVVAAHFRQDSWRTGGAWLTTVDLEPRVATFGTYGQRQYLFYGPDYGREVVTVRADSEEALRKELDRHGLRMLFAYSVDPRSPQGRVLAQAVEKKWLLKIAESVYYSRR